MPDSNALVFVFASVQAARSAVERLGEAGVATDKLEVDGGLERYGLASVYGPDACILTLHVHSPHDEAYVKDLVCGASGRLVPVPADDTQELNLELEYLRTCNLWRSILESDVPMAVAAAMLFHRLYGDRRNLIKRAAYDEALNIAASALSRLVPVYTIGAVTGRRVEVAINLVTHRFAGRATQLRSLDGDTVTERLFVRRSELLSAVPVIERAGLPFSLAHATPK